MLLFKDGEYRVSPRFHLLVSDVNQGNKERDEFKISLHDHRDEKILLRFSTGY